MANTSTKGRFLLHSRIKRCPITGMAIFQIALVTTVLAWITACGSAQETVPH